MKKLFSPSSTGLKAIVWLFVATSLFGIDKKEGGSHSSQEVKSGTDCPGGVCSARPALEDDLFGGVPLFQQPQSDSPPAAAKENLTLKVKNKEFSLSPAAKIDTQRFEKYSQKIQEQENLLKSKLRDLEGKKTAVIIGAKEGVTCLRCDAAAQAYKKAGFTVIKVPYSEVPHLGSAMWLQEGQKGNPQFPFVAFWSGKNFFYRSYQP